MGPNYIIFSSDMHLSTESLYIIYFRKSQCLLSIKYRSWQISQIMLTIRKKSLFYQMLF